MITDKQISLVNAIKKITALLMALLLLSPPLLAGTYKGTGTKPDTSYIIYIPEKLDIKHKRYPWIMAFSPDGNGMAALNAMKEACDQNNWILVASNNSRNGVPIDTIQPYITDTINSAVRTLAVDPSKMYAGGLSGGGMVSHWLMQKYPTLLKGLITNCGMINADWQKELGYPSHKDIVFMTNPQDFRYNEIKANYQYITGRGCRTCWIEFPGGHRWAPPEYYAKAFAWLNKQAQSH